MKKSFFYALFIAVITMSCGNKTNKEELNTQEESTKVEVSQKEEPIEEVNTAEDSVAVADSTADVAQDETTVSPDSAACTE